MLASICGCGVFRLQSVVSSWSLYEEILQPRVLRWLEPAIALGNTDFDLIVSS